VIIFKKCKKCLFLSFQMWYDITETTYGYDYWCAQFNTACDNRELGVNPKQSCCRDNVTFSSAMRTTTGINFLGR